MKTREYLQRSQGKPLDLVVRVTIYTFCIGIEWMFLTHQLTVELRILQWCMLRRSSPAQSLLLSLQQLLQRWTQQPLQKYTTLINRFKKNRRINKNVDESLCKSRVSYNQSHIWSLDIIVLVPLYQWNKLHPHRFVWIFMLPLTKRYRCSYNCSSAHSNR